MAVFGEQTAWLQERQQNIDCSGPPICLPWLLSKLSIGSAPVNVPVLYVQPVGFASHAL